MEKENIAVIGTPKKNKLADIFFQCTLALIPVCLVAIGAMVATYRDSWYYRRYYSFVEYFFAKFFLQPYGYLILLAIGGFVAFFILRSMTKKCEITVTNARIYGKTAFGNKVNIPLNEVTDVSLCPLNGISVVSLTNVSNFYCFANRKEVVKAISYFLVNAGSPQTTPANGSHIEAERLRQCKALFDAGEITQEEFNARKKDILGL